MICPYNKSGPAQNQRSSVWYCPLHSWSPCHPAPRVQMCLTLLIVVFAWNLAVNMIWMITCAISISCRMHNTGSKLCDVPSLSGLNLSHRKSIATVLLRLRKNCVMWIPDALACQLRSPETSLSVLSVVAMCFTAMLEESAVVQKAFAANPAHHWWTCYW